MLLPAGGLAQEINGKTGRDRQRNDADFAKDGDIERDIGNRHENRPGHCSTGPQLARSNFVCDRGPGITNGPDYALCLRELDRNERRDFLLCSHLCLLLKPNVHAHWRAHAELRKAPYSRARPSGACC